MAHATPVSANYLPSPAAGGQQQAGRRRRGGSRQGDGNGDGNGGGGNGGGGTHQRGQVSSPRIVHSTAPHSRHRQLSALLVRLPRLQLLPGGARVSQCLQPSLLPGEGLRSQEGQTDVAGRCLLKNQTNKKSIKKGFEVQGQSQR